MEELLASQKAELDIADQKALEYKKHFKTAAGSIETGMSKLADSLDKFNNPDKVKEEDKAKHEFKMSGEKITPIACPKFNCQGIIYCRDIKAAVREAIGRNEFISLSKLLHDNAGGTNVQETDMRSDSYMTRNVPAAPESIRSIVELICRLMLFGSYYLQVYPEKTVSFLDYILYLMDYSESLNINGLVALDHVMRQDFAANPDLNWSEHRNENHSALTRITIKERYKKSYNPFGQKNKGYPSSSAGSSSSTNNKRKGGGGSDQSKSSNKKHKSMDEMKKEICKNFNAGKCKWGRNCYRQHVCSTCKQNHKSSDCSVESKTEL